MSVVLVISISLLITVLVLGFAAVTFRCYKLQKLTHSGLMEHSSSNSHDLGRTTTTRYSDLRENERLRRDSQHSQACILGKVLPITS